MEEGVRRIRLGIFPDGLVGFLGGLLGRRSFIIYRYHSNGFIMMSIRRQMVIVLCLLILSSIIYFELSMNKTNEEFTEKSPKILFTCTSYISKPNKLDSLKKTLDSFIKYTPSDDIDRMIVINEYGENTADTISDLEEKYPQIDFINKKENDKGQARSINMIIDILREGKYDYWLHWEDSWIVTEPFLTTAVDIMLDDQVDQLQLIPRWEDIPDERRKMWTTKSGEKYVEILKINDSIEEQLNPFGTCSDFKSDWWGENLKNWPLFSLSPGIDKVDKILRVGYFDNSPDKWPITFEFEWSVKWLCNGARKAILEYAICERVDGHKSTYD